MGKKIRTGVKEKSHKQKTEDRLKPATYKGYIISFTKKDMPIKVGDKFIDEPIEWHVKGERGYEESKEDCLKEAKKWIDKSFGFF